MIAAIVFSRDRAMQLDLLLRSLERNGGGLFDPVYVLRRATSPAFKESYEICDSEYPQVEFMVEHKLISQVRFLLGTSDHTVFFTDDDVLYRPLPFLHPIPMANWLCFSLRLGFNTTWCYPHKRRQGVPRLLHEGDLLAWNWWNADGDFGYPASLDGHVFQTETIRRALVNLTTAASPNGLEEHLTGTLRNDLRPMSSYRISHLVGLPLNRVNTTNPNRHGEVHSYDVDELNSRYLVGERIDLDVLDFSSIQGAHQEMELQFV